jgi:hypothetical protein
MAHKQSNPTDISGLRFGRLVAISRSQEHPRKWNVRCDCGRETAVRRYSLLSGDTSSCGCLRSEVRALDLTGQRFGRLLVLKPLPNKRTPRGSLYSLCLCDCGREVEIVSRELPRGHTKSCGCWSAQMTADRSRTHGLCGTPTYQSWNAMRQRCGDASQTYYERYGGSGITVCERWKLFSNFLEDMGVRPEGKTLDRIDNSGNYEPGNCRWATRKEQARNTSANFFITHNGETKCLAEWAEHLGMCRMQISRRIRNGWPVEMVLTPKVEQGEANE